MLLFSSSPGPKFTPSSSRLDTGEKLIIASSDTKDVYIRPCISLIGHHMQIYTCLFTSFLVVRNAVFLIITGGGKDFRFPNEKFPDFVHPYNLSKNNSFLTAEAINLFYCSHREKKKGTRMWNAWVLCVFVLFYHGNWREAGLQLIKGMTSWYYAVTKSFIIVDMGFRNPPLVCLFPVQNITKKIKI